MGGKVGAAERDGRGKTIIWIHYVIKKKSIFSKREKARKVLLLLNRQNI